MPGNAFGFTLLRDACYERGKVLDDAVHLVAGFEHEPRKDESASSPSASSSISPISKSGQKPNSKAATVTFTAGGNRRREPKVISDCRAQA
jgi:hypothetical protein